MRIAVIVLGGLGVAWASLPAAAQSTTRIETRPFYGASVTVEEGVRVFRGLPPHDRIIINPDGKTPLSLAFQASDNRTYTRNYIYNVDGTEAGPDGAGAYLSNRYIRRYVPPRTGGGVK